jgi:MFS family permease
MLARFIAGLPHGAYFGVAALVAAHISPPEQRGTAVGRVMLGLSVALVVGNPLATWLGQVMGWRHAFALVSLRPDAEGPEQVAEEALAALKAEYPGLEPIEATGTVAGAPAIGHDIDFLTLDTTITCWTRCIDTTGGPLLVMGQVSEYDRERNEPVLRAVFASVELDE